jgi:hypothetical protein
VEKLDKSPFAPPSKVGKYTLWGKLKAKRPDRDLDYDVYTLNKDKHDEHTTTGTLLWSTTFYVGSDRYAKLEEQARLYSTNYGIFRY